MAQPRAEAVGTVRSPVGRLVLTATPAGLAAVSWVGQPSRVLADARPDHRLLAAATSQLAEYFAGDRREFDLTLDWPMISRVAHAVLTTLLATVTYGEVVTYGELARRSGTEVPARAIGTLMGANPLPIVVPCHRVVAGDGLGGYSGGPPGRGLEVKRWLLTMEGALPPTLDWDPAGIDQGHAGSR